MYWEIFALYWYLILANVVSAKVGYYLSGIQ